MFRGRYDRQRTLAIRIAAITLASDSAIAIPRFRPSKTGILEKFGRQNGRKRGIEGEGAKGIGKHGLEKPIEVDKLD